MYISASSKKIARFLTLVAVLIVLVLITLAIMKTDAGRYLSPHFNVERLKISIKTIDYHTRLYGIRLASLLAPFGLSGQNVLADYEKAQDIPVLVYHGIGDDKGQFTVTEDQFWDHMSTLKKAGYRTITLDEFEDFIEGDEVPPGRVFLLTFDDGRTDSYYNADPILKVLDYSAVMFVAPQSSFYRQNDYTSYYLNEQLMHAMIDSRRWEIGSHAMQQNGGHIPVDEQGNTDNFLSSKMWLADQGRLESDDEYRQRVNKELAESKRELRERLRVPISFFSYPFNDYGQQASNNSIASMVIAEAVKANYSFAFQQSSPRDNMFSTNYAQDDPHHLKRLEPLSDVSGRELLDVLESITSKSLNFRDEFDDHQGWKSTWGDFRFESGRGIISAKDDTTGAMPFLEGTGSWQDYISIINANWDKGSHVSLIARYKNDANYASCIFGDGSVKIEQRVNGQDRSLSGVNNPLIMPRSNVFLGISVSGNTVKCYAGARAVASASSLDPALARGGVALKVWDQQMNNAVLSVDYIETASIERESDLRSKMSRYSPIFVPEESSGEEEVTPSPSPTITQTPTQTQTQTKTPTPTITKTPTKTPTITPKPTTSTEEERRREELRRRAEEYLREQEARRKKNRNND